MRARSTAWVMPRSRQWVPVFARSSPANAGLGQSGRLQASPTSKSEARDHRAIPAVPAWIFRRTDGVHSGHHASRGGGLRPTSPARGHRPAHHRRLHRMPGCARPSAVVSKGRRIPGLSVLRHPRCGPGFSKKPAIVSGCANRRTSVTRRSLINPCNWILGTKPGPTIQVAAKPPFSDH
jgi:hypothetical protein